MKYQSEIIKEIVDVRGHEKPSLHYQSECVESWIYECKGAYPKLCDYQSEWLNYINENPIGEFPYETVTDVTEATINNVVPYSYKSATLKGSTKYRDIETGEFLETFEEGRNLELVSVNMPILTTSNEDGSKSNILTVNEDVTLRGIGDVQDTLDCLTGELTERIGEIVLDGSEAWTYGHGNSNETIALFYANLDHNVEYKPSINDKLPSIEGYSVNFGEGIYVDSDINIRIKRNKLNGSTVDNFKQWLSNNPITLQYILNQSNIKTVDLTVVNQDGEILNKIKPIEGTMHISTDGTPLKPSISMEVPVEAITQNLASFIKEE